MVAIIGYSMLFPHSLLSTIEMGYKPTTVIIVVVSQVIVRKGPNFETSGPFLSEQSPNPTPEKTFFGAFDCFRALDFTAVGFEKIYLGNCKVGGTTGSPRIKLLRAESSQKQKPEKPPPIGDLKAPRSP